MAAMILGGTEMVQQAIDERRKLKDSMVGTLYPSILAEEIEQLQEILK